MIRNSIRCLALLSAVWAIQAACSQQPNPVAPPAAIPSPSARAEIRAAIEGRTIRGFEDNLLRLENAIPGFGGMFQDGEHSMVVYLTDLRNRGLAIRGLQKNAHYFSVDTKVFADVRGGRVKFRQGQFSFSQLVDWQAKVSNSLVGFNQLVYVDADESINRVRVRVIHGSDLVPFRLAIGALGLPTDAVVFDFGQPIAPMTLQGQFPNGTAGGMQIANENDDKCTLGFHVVDSTGQHGFLTASHCSATPRGGGMNGDTIYQHKDFTGLEIGEVLLNPLWQEADISGRCQGIARCSLADAMFVKKIGPRPDYPWIASTKLRGTNNQWGSIDETSAWRQDVDTFPVGVEPWPGMKIDKIGRTTGWTQGTLVHTCVSAADRTSSPTHTAVWCAAQVDSSSIGQGDSGGPVFFDNHTKVFAVGIVFGAANGFMPLNNTRENFCGVPYQCSYYYSQWEGIRIHLGRRFIP